VACGYNRNPTSKSFRCGFASICSFSLLNCASEKSNFEDDEDNFLTPEILTDLLIDDTPQDKDVDVPKSTFIASSSDSDDTYDCTEGESLPMSSLSLEKCSLEYYAGYLAMKCFKKFQCKKCYYQLINTNESLVDNKDLLFILHKTFDHIEWTSTDVGLKAPTKELVDFVHESLKVFQNYYKHLKWKKKLVSTLVNMAENKIKTVYWKKVSYYFHCAYISLSPCICTSLLLRNYYSKWSNNIVCTHYNVYTIIFICILNKIILY